MGCPVGAPLAMVRGEVPQVDESQPVFNQINLVVRDMTAMVEFYRRLGVDFTDTISPWDRHHRTFAAGSVVSEFDFDLDSQAFVTNWNEGWPANRTGTVFGFRLPSTEAVDRTFMDLTSAGYVSPRYEPRRAKQQDLADERRDHRKVHGVADEA